MNFSAYYNKKFQQDLLLFFSKIPEESKFHEDREKKQIFSVQYAILNPAAGHLNHLVQEERMKFALALYFTVLTDMVCYTHFRHLYPRFQNLTRYPKFIGNCPGGCRYHFHPRDIFFGMKLSFNCHSENFQLASDAIKQEVYSFCQNHMPELDPENFWNRCKKEFPRHHLSLSLPTVAKRKIHPDK